MSEFYRSVLNHIEEAHPEIWRAVQAHPPASVLFSPHSVNLQRSDLTTIQSFIDAIHAIKCEPAYIKSLYLHPTAQHEIQNTAAFTSYDFHITPTGPKLIEINTNASLYIWAAIINEVQSRKLNLFGDDYIGHIKKMLMAEAGKTQPRVVIVDEAPQSQRAYSEFLAYRGLFQSWGWPTDISDIKDADYKNYDFVYNRSTDFYFDDPTAHNLKQAYLSNEIVCSPSPREYGIIADKQRLIDLRKYAKDRFLVVMNVIPDCGIIANFPDKDSKKARQHYFYKPLRSHGGKAVYSGKTLSNKVFAEILEKDYLYQEHIDPPHLKTPDGREWKWDLRVYCYENTIQQIIARLYEGQTTNTRTEGGGGAAVHIL